MDVTADFQMVANPQVGILDEAGTPESSEQNLGRSSLDVVEIKSGTEEENVDPDSWNDEEEQMMRKLEAKRAR